MRRLACFSLVLAVDGRPCRRTKRRVAHLSRHLSGNRFSPLNQINTGNVARLAPKWMFPIPGAPRALASHAGRRRWRDVRHLGRTKPTRSMRATAARSGTTAGRARRAWPATRPAASIAASRCSATACSWSSDNAHLLALHRLTGQLHLGRRDGRLAPELRLHRRAAGGQRPGDRRRLRRRRRHPRISRRLQGFDRRARLALLDHSRARRARVGDLESAARSNTAAAPPGSPAPTIRKRDCSTGPPAIPAPTTTATSARATTSTPHRCWRSIPPPES